MSDSYYTPHRSLRECRYWWFDGWEWAVNYALSRAGTPRICVEPGEIAIDPHIHTLFSHCSISRPDRILMRAARIGLGGIAVTDHNDTRGAADTALCAEHLKREGLLPEDFLVIPGVEISSAAGHIVGLFVRESLPERLAVGEAARLIHEAGGLAVAPHPYHSTGVCDAVFDARWDAVEIECGSVFSSRLVRQNAGLAYDPRLAHAARLGASDAHYANAIGLCYTVLEACEPTLEAAREAIAQGRARACVSDPCTRMRRMLGGIRKLR